MSDLNDLQSTLGHFDTARANFEAFQKGVGVALGGPLRGAVGFDAGVAAVPTFGLACGGTCFRISLALRSWNDVFGQLVCEPLDARTREVSGGRTTVIFNSKGEANGESMKTPDGAANIIASLVMPHLSEAMPARGA